MMTLNWILLPITIVIILVGVLVLFLRWRKSRKTIGRTTSMLKGVTTRLAENENESDPLGWLLVTEGAKAGQEYPLGKTPVLKIGRDPQFCDIALYDEFASNPHVSLIFDKSQFFIVDEGSTNGTRVNGSPIQPYRRHLLEDGDVIEIGQTKLQFRSTLQRWIDQIETHLRQKGRVKLKDLKGLPQGRSGILSDYATTNAGLDLVYYQEDQTLSLKQIEKFRDLREVWYALEVQKDTTQITHLIKRIVQTLSQLLNLRIDAPKIKKYEQLYYTLVDTGLTFQGLKIPARIPVFFSLEGRVDEYQLDCIRYTLTDLIKTPVHLFLLIVITNEGDQKSEEIDWLLSEKLGEPFAYDPILLTFEDLYYIIASQKSQKAFKQYVLSHVSLITVSPYSTTGPTPDNVFFGREAESREIVEHSRNKSYAVIGGRRIGKSSLLGRLHRTRLPAAGFHTLYHDCSTTPSRDTFLNATIRHWHPKPIDVASDTFKDLLQSSPDDKPLVLLLDEADKLVPADRTNGWPLFNALRALANSGRAQVVLSGERTLRDALRDPKSPLFNFANEILLGPLNYRAVEELVTRPMKQLEIELENEKALVDQIWDFTSGHPNVVQRLCRRLIERLNEQDTRRITTEDVNSVIENPAFQRDDFLSTYLEAATPLERIISLLMADDGEVRTLRALRQALEDRCDLQPSAREIDDALQRLVDLRSILKRTPTGYEFAVKAFPRVVAGTMTLNDMLMILTEEYEEQGE